jgi:cytochrome d ubiquinol oxidase subunit II
MVLGAAVALYPTVLPSSGNRAYDLTIFDAASGPETLRLALYWWIPGVAIAITYIVFVYRLFKGKATAGGYGH